MAEIEANVIPLNDTTCKLKFINFDAPKSAGITEITYDGDTYNVIFDGYTNNSYVIVDASFADFDSQKRVIIEADIPDPPDPPEPPVVLNLRLPTETEWNTERLSWGSNNADGAFGSPLKLSMAGRRNDGVGTITLVDVIGFYWCSTVLGTRSQSLNIESDNALVFEYNRAFGFSVRLILEGTFSQQQFDDNYSGQTIVIDGLTYGYVYNTTTSRIWLDRNLGATQVATSSTDADSYGWLYQWGRLTDGHQIRTSTTTTTLSTGDVPGNNSFIRNSVSPRDWRNPQNNNLWQGVDGINNPAN